MAGKTLLLLFFMHRLDHDNMHVPRSNKKNKKKNKKTKPLTRKDKPPPNPVENTSLEPSSSGSSGSCKESESFSSHDAEVGPPQALRDSELLDIDNQNLDYVDLKQIAVEMGSVRILNLQRNKLKTLPVLPSSVQVINLSHNEFTGLIDFTLPSYMREINLSNNFLKGLCVFIAVSATYQIDSCLLGATPRSAPCLCLTTRASCGARC